MRIRPFIVLAITLLNFSQALQSQTPTSTSLDIRIIAGTTPELSWIVDSQSFTLQVAPEAHGPWSSLPLADQLSQTNAGRIQVRDLRPGPATRFYRLASLQPPNPSSTNRPGPAYDTGKPNYRTIFVNSQAGSDENDGSTPARAYQTLSGAWNSLPVGTQAAATRIALLPGRYAGAYLEDRLGTLEFPILIEPASGPNTVEFQPTPEGDAGSLQLLNCSHVYLQDMRVNVRGGDGVHFEKCDHMLIRRMKINSVRSEGQDETLKVNQSSHIYIEDSEISDAGDNCIDVVAVQHGHVVRCKIHNSTDWGFYLKGGSAYWLVEGNEIYDCGTGGFTAGQGTGFQFMTPPWIHYETYDVKVVNNIIHHTEGAGLGVNGSYNVLMAHNTLYRVGTRSHAVEFVHGRRGCDGMAVAECQPLLDLGGWGTIAEEEQFIPNRNILFINNLIYNPPGVRSAFQHFEIRGAVHPPAGGNVSDPSLADDGLKIAGNWIWNGPTDLPLGNEEPDSGCHSLECNATQFARDNLINSTEPSLVAPESGLFTPANDRLQTNPAKSTIPDFNWSDAPTRPTVPAGNLSNAVVFDWQGNPRSNHPFPGALQPTPPQAASNE